MTGADLESIISDFEQALASSTDVDIRDFAPDPNDEHYLEIVTELIRVDFDLGWNTEHRKTIDDYRRLFPDVLQNEHCFDRIAFEEYRLRASSGEDVAPYDYQNHYDIKAYHWPVQPKSNPKGQTTVQTDAETVGGSEFSEAGSLELTQTDLAAKIARGRLASTPTVESSLHGRLRYIGLTMLITLLYLSILGWLNPINKVGLFLGSPWLLWLNGFCIIVCMLTCIVLWGKHRIQITYLRILEFILFGSVLAELSCGLASDLFIDRELARPMSEGDPNHALFHYASSWSLPFFALIVAYGILVPSNWRRCTVIVSIIAIIPVVICTIAAIALHGFVFSFFQSFFLQMVIWMATAAAIAVYGVRRLEESRDRLLKSGKLGKYQLIRRVATGGMGEVFLAEHSLMNRRCAIKLMHPNWSLDPQLLARFEREVQALAGISHPNVVQIYDFGFTDAGVFYYVMEYLDGRNLDQVVNESGPIEVGKVIEIVLEIVDALHIIHTGGIIHRDLKPSNIFLATSDRGEKTKLLDFGLIKIVSRQDQEEELTMDGAIIGTPAYMSPEQAAGGSIDHRTDIYSLGAVACFALTGKHVFERSSTVETLTAQIVSEVPSMIESNQLIPSQLQDILFRSLSKDPGCRFQTAVELSTALRSINV